MKQCNNLTLKQSRLSRDASGQVITKSFTLIEILVVATIISLLAGIGMVSYSSITKSSLDARRKADLEQIRAAIEMYRSNNSSYPTTLSFGGNLCDPAPTGCPPVGNKYLEKVPQDPKSTIKTYYYTGSSSDYTLASQLEGSSTCSSPPGGNSCGTGFPCNYCLGPYGQK